MKRKTKGKLGAIAVGIALGVIARSLAPRSYIVSGISMEPTFENGDYVIYEKGEIQRGDVVLVRVNGMVLIKRVIGIGGDTIAISNGNVYRNGMLLDEPYALIDHSSLSITTVPDNEIFVLGDNRANSSDSRNWGSIPMSACLGIVNTASR